jgi:hypothetical protein
MYRFAITAAAIALAGVGAARAATGPAAPPAGRGSYNPFAMQRARAAPNDSNRAALERRMLILRRLAAIRVTPPGAQRPRSAFRTGRPAATPPPFTPAGGSVGTNPAGNTTGRGNAQRR